MSVATPDRRLDRRLGRGLDRLGGNGVFLLCLAGLAIAFAVCFVWPLTPQFLAIHKLPTNRDWVIEGKPQGYVKVYFWLTAGAYVFGIWQWRQGRRPSWKLVLGGALLLAALALLVPPVSSDDIYAYSFYGKVQSFYHANPYLSFPLQHAYDEWFPFWSWPDIGPVYGPPFLLLMRVVAMLSGASILTWVILMKLVMTAAIAGGVGLLVRAVRGVPTVDPRWPVFAVAWNPVVLQGIMMTAHVDALLFLLVAGAVLAHRREHRLVAFVLLVAMVAIKVYMAPLVVLYVVWLVRRDPVRRALGRLLAYGAAALGLLVIAYLPYASAGRGLFSSVTAVGQDFNNSSGPNVVRLVIGAFLPYLNGGDQAAADWFAASAARDLSIAVIAAVLVVQAVRIRRQDEPWPAMATYFLAYLLLTPWVFYWHELPLLALVAVIPWGVTSLAALVLGLNLVPSSPMHFPLEYTDLSDLASIPSALLGFVTHYAGAWAVLAWAGWRRWRHREPDQGRTGAGDGAGSAALARPAVTSRR